MNDFEINELYELAKAIVVTTLTALSMAFAWAVPLSLFWNGAVILWVSDTLLPITYWQCVGAVMALKFVRSLIKG